VRDPEVDELWADTLAGRPEAWQKLWQAVEPRLYATLRRPNLLGRLSQSEDDCRNIVLEVMGRLRADDFARLAQFAEARRQNPRLPFMSWLIVVAKRVAIDYLRAHETYIDRRHVDGASSPGAWRDVGTLPPASQLPGERPAMTARGTAHELLEFAATELPEPPRSARGSRASPSRRSPPAATPARRSAPCAPPSSACAGASARAAAR
jgi:DNA-directed RNA polymerase specialized sigma24 family protein